MKKLLAFTLAETLIVMSIIGVVAALTIPNLNHSTGEKEKVAKVKKIYSDLNDALGRAQAVYGPFDEWFQNDNTREEKITRFGERLTEFMKIQKNCKTEINKGCLTSSENAFRNDSQPEYYRFITADGISVSLWEVKDNFICIYVDIDKPNKSNHYPGVSIFQFRARNNELIVESEDLYLNYCARGKAIEQPVGAPDALSRGCAAWITRYGNMDYLKVDLSGKCSNGIELSVNNTTCK